MSKKIIQTAGTDLPLHIFPPAEYTVSQMVVGTPVLC